MTRVSTVSITIISLKKKKKKAKHSQLGEFAFFFHFHKDDDDDSTELKSFTSFYELLDRSFVQFLFFCALYLKSENFSFRGWNLILFFSSSSPLPTSLSIRSKREISSRQAACELGKWISSAPRDIRNRKLILIACASQQWEVIETQKYHKKMPFLCTSWLIWGCCDHLCGAIFSLFFRSELRYAHKFSLSFGSILFGFALNHSAVLTFKTFFADDLWHSRIIQHSFSLARVRSIWARQAHQTDRSLQPDIVSIVVNFRMLSRWIKASSILRLSPYSRISNTVASSSSLFFFLLPALHQGSAPRHQLTFVFYPEKYLDIAMFELTETTKINK